ncbi:MAG: TMEM43 family protein [Spirulinaceae cyanobacterium]
MANQHSKVTQTGWLGRIGQSFVGVLLGLLLFFAAFMVLYLNEGRTDFGKVAQSAVEVSLDGAAANAQGELVSATGAVTTSETLGDDEFLTPDTYLAFWREVEMYAWEERTESETARNTGGSETTETTYIYRQVWTSSPEDSSSFEVSEGHENPELLIADQYGAATQMQIGAYQLLGDRLTLPQPDEPLDLTPESIEVSEEVTLEAAYLFQGVGTLEEPEIGDLRIQYYALPSGTELTVFGRLMDGVIRPHLTRRQDTFYRALVGTRAEAIAQLKGEYKTALWIFRVVGFFMLWIGLMLISGPLAVFLDFLPFVGDIFRSVSGVASFFAAFLIWSVTVMISILLHNIVAMIAAGVAILGVWFGVKRWVLRSRDA